MGKLVTLKFGHGSFEQGFPVTLEIRDSSNFKQGAILERSAKLPSKNLPDIYEKWREIYRGIETRYRQSRLTANTDQTTNFSMLECQQAADKLLEDFNDWLCSRSFQILRDSLSQNIAQSEQVRIIIQAEDRYIQKLPWHLWEFITRNHPDTEVSFSNLP